MRICVFGVLFVILIADCAAGSVTRYINKASWFAATSDVTPVTFQGFPEFTLITSQYASLGVVFPDGNDRVEFNDSFLNDGVGLGSNDFIYGTIHLAFAQPRTALATDFLGTIDIQLYAKGQVIYDSDGFDTVQSRFGGLISTIPFDAAVIRDPSDGVVVIDDLFFGPAVPGPGALFLLALAAGFRARRRRSL